MSRPSEAEIREALSEFQSALEYLPGGPDEEGITALRVLSEAVKPREVWPAKEAAWCFGVQVSNLRTVRGITECVAWEFPRPRVDKPDQMMRLYWRDLVEAHPKAIETAARRAEKEGG